MNDIKGQLNNEIVSFNQTKFLKIIEHAEDFGAEGFSVKNIYLNEKGCPDMWRYEGAVYFCFTVVTTIGYGNIAPNTVYGRLFFMFYALPGIGLCGALISEIQNIFKIIFNEGKRKIHDQLWSLILYWICILMAILIIFWFLPALVTYIGSDMDFFESLYFMMVTVTTVGFGDAGLSGHGSLKFILIISTYMSVASFSVIIEIVQLLIAKLTNKI